LTKAAEAFSPAGISSFFEICDMAADGTSITELERVGSRGGGFVLTKGVHTKVEVSEAKRNKVEVLIDRQLAPQAETTRTVAERLLTQTDKKYAVTINHFVEIPIGAGFGSSAGGALGTALALSNALDLNLTYNQLGRIAHVAEVKCKTGLGTVGPIMLGGCIITVEPGAPGIGVIDRIPLRPDYVVVTGVFGFMPTKQVLSSADKRQRVSLCGRKTLDAILAEPTLENFLSSCWSFAEETGFATERVRQLVKLAKKAGAVNAAQNMIGEAVHAVALEENADDVAEAFKQVLPKEKVLKSKIDFQGARLVGTHERI